MLLEGASIWETYFPRNVTFAFHIWSFSIAKHLESWDWDIQHISLRCFSIFFAPCQDSRSGTTPVTKSWTLLKTSNPLHPPYFPTPRVSLMLGTCMSVNSCRSLRENSCLRMRDTKPTQTVPLTDSNDTAMQCVTFRWLQTMSSFTVHLWKFPFPWHFPCWYYHSVTEFTMSFTCTDKCRIFCPINRAQIFTHSKICTLHGEWKRKSLLYSQ